MITDETIGLLSAILSWPVVALLALAFAAFGLLDKISESLGKTIITSAKELQKTKKHFEQIQTQIYSSARRSEIAVINLNHKQQ